MAIETITYSDNADGWTSFWDYYPDWMIGLSNVFYSWKDGDLWKQNCKFTIADPLVPVNRNYFYGTPFAAKIKTIFNEDSGSVKMFKTLSLDSTSAWTATISTDLDLGSINGYTEYVEKEAGWFGFIRANSPTSNSNSLLSTQGVGYTSPTSLAGGTATFTFDITTRFGSNDRVYFNNVFVGLLQTSTANTISISGGTGFPAGAGYVYIVKNSIAESFGLRGYYMQVELQLFSPYEEELYSMSTSLFKSYF